PVIIALDAEHPVRNLIIAADLPTAEAAAHSLAAEISSGSKRPQKNGTKGGNDPGKGRDKVRVGERLLRPEATAIAADIAARPGEHGDDGRRPAENRLEPPKICRLCRQCEQSRDCGGCKQKSFHL